MNIGGFRQSKRHRTMPLREAVAWQSENAISCASLQREIKNTRSDTGCLSLLSRVIVSSNSGMLIFSSSVIPQIPIGRCTP
jgi:hypothetical protein